MRWGYGFREYVPVGQRRYDARAYAKELADQVGRSVQPVELRGKKIASTFWGKAWCDNLESYSDFANRLPRGRTYVRNGSVVDLMISAGRLDAVVAGSEPYQIEVQIDPVKPAAWKKIRQDCAASIDSLIDLLGGRFSDGVMQRLTRKGDGLFPSPREIHLDCSCPDWARLCKHVAAVLYGVGAQLDSRPELLFLLRGVDHTQLVSEAASRENLSTALGEGSGDLAGEDLSEMFGIELDDLPSPAVSRPSRRKKTAAATKPVGKVAAKKKTTKKKAKTKADVGTQSTTKKKRTVAATRKQAVDKKVVELVKQAAARRKKPAPPQRAIRGKSAMKKSVKKGSMASE